MAAANCPERTNWYQCIRLLMEGGRTVLKEFIKKSYIPTPGSLDLFLNLKPNKDSLSSLHKRKILNKDQWDKLFPSADLENMDITLLSCIICYCIAQPRSEERRAVDDLRELRNSLHGHACTESMNKDEFERNWKKITTVLSKAQHDLGVNISLNEFITKIENEKVFNNDLVWDELEAWERVDALMRDMKEQKKEISDVKERMSNIEKKFEDEKKLTIDEKALMEVSCQGATSQVTDSDSADLLCDQCSESGQVVIAAGLCRTCPNYLCRECISQHNKVRLLRHHEILDGADMPERRPCSTGVEYCSLHPERQIEMFCSEKHNHDDESFILVKKHSKSLRQNVKNIKQINIKSCEDSKDCTINGIVQISETKLIVSDYSNKCLKVVDVETYTITNRRQLTSIPGDITMLPYSRVAVALPHLKQIQIFTTDGDLDHCGCVKVDGNCIALHCNESQLFVSYDKPVAKVQILDLTGRVQTTIQHDASRAALFAVPKHIAYSPDNHRVYVSDLKKDTVTCITTEGEVQWTYNGPDVKWPMGLALGDNECMYICSQDTHSVHLVSPGGEKLAVITKDQTGVWYPWAVHYSSLSQTLYMSSASTRPEDKNFIRRLTLT